MHQEETENTNQTLSRGFGVVGKNWYKAEPQPCKCLTLSGLPAYHNWQGRSKTLRKSEN